MINVMMYGNNIPSVQTSVHSKVQATLAFVCFCLLLVAFVLINRNSCFFFLLTDETMVINVFCGVVSGVLSSSLANPTDVLKVIVNAGDSAKTNICLSINKSSAQLVLIEIVDIHQPCHPTSTCSSLNKESFKTV